MTTIHLAEELILDKTYYKTMEEFQVSLKIQEKKRTKEHSLSDAHKKIIDDRMAEAEANPENYITYQEFKDLFKLWLLSTPAAILKSGKSANM